MWTAINEIYVLFAKKQISKCALAVLPKWIFSFLHLNASFELCMEL